MYATIELFNFLGNKVEIIKMQLKCGIPYISNVCAKIENYEHFQQLSSELGSERVVVQGQHGRVGSSTMFINNTSDYNRLQHRLENGEIMKIMPFKNLKSLSINAVLTKTGTFIGPLFAQVIGHK